MKRFCNYLFWPLIVLIAGFHILRAGHMGQKYLKNKQCYSQKRRYKVLATVTKWICLYYRVDIHKVEGFDTIPNTPSLIISNHKDRLDWIICLYVFSHYKNIPYTVVVAKQELRTTNRFIARAMDLVDGIFINRTNLRSTFEVYEKEKQAIKNGYAVCVSIEGGYDKGHEFLEYKKAVLKLAYEFKIPITPLLIYGSIGLSDKEQLPYYNHSRKVTLIAQPILYPDQFLNIDPQQISEQLKQEQETLYFELKNKD